MKKTISAFALVATLSIIAFAGWTVDSQGYGFVGKGDVQLALGLNNKGLQDGSFNFTVSSVSETTWECVNSNNENIQERSRTTTTEGLVSSVARVKNQITGFNLEGFSGATTSETDGPALNSCPSGPWSYVAGSTVTTPGEGSVLSVNGTPIP